MISSWSGGAPLGPPSSSRGAAEELGLDCDNRAERGGVEEDAREAADAEAEVRIGADAASSLSSSSAEGADADEAGAHEPEDGPAPVPG